MNLYTCGLPYITNESNARGVPTNIVNNDQKRLTGPYRTAFFLELVYSIAYFYFYQIKKGYMCAIFKVWYILCLTNVDQLTSVSGVRELNIA